MSLVVQPDGGALASGGIPGSVVGSGRPPSPLRDKRSGSFEQRCQVLPADSENGEETTRLASNRSQCLSRAVLLTKASLAVGTVLRHTSFSQASGETK